MSPPTDPHDTDLSILAYVSALAAVFAVFAFGLFWLVQPHASPNPGLAAYKPPLGISVPLTTSAETAMAMERSARHAAGENKTSGNLLKQAGALQIVANQREQFLCARLDDFCKRASKNCARRPVTDAGNFDGAVFAQQSSG